MGREKERTGDERPRMGAEKPRMGAEKPRPCPEAEIARPKPSATVSPSLDMLAIDRGDLYYQR